MKIQPLWLLLLLYHCPLFAQNNAVLIVRAGSTIKESVAATDLYEYPQFTRGTVFFRDGNSSGGTLNYNRLLDEMQFIAAGGDTLSLANEKNIAFINIGADTFFYDQGYIKLVNHTAHIKLGIKQMLRIIDKQKVGAYGMASATTAIDSYNTLYDGSKIYDLAVQQELVLKRKVQYYLGNSGNQFVPADRKNLLNRFSKKQGAVKDYLKANPVAFDSPEDLERLVQFLARL